MTERPILFSGEMVRAILDGRKTQTRRKMKVQPPPDARVTVEHYTSIVTDRRYGDMKPGKKVFGALWDGGECGLPCPYGQPGDHLWVRESGAWRDGVVAFAATDLVLPLGQKWKPSIHMPRWASRITLRITDIRVERLQDISEEDARAEGARRFDDLPSMHPYGQDARWSMDVPTTTDQCLGTARFSFAHFWNSINGPGAWEANPWVWAISFEDARHLCKGIGGIARAALEGKGDE
ncbi:MAG: hypothetical protein ING08_08155 [Roseomonas sp.]|nr:hypothetical protein [Roseomonas sp.]